MKFLVDQCCEKSVTITLREAEYDVVSVDESMPGCPDAEILERAYKDGRIVITEDKDFGEMLFRLHRRSMGIMLLRFRADERHLRNSRLLDVLKNKETLLAGNFIVITRDKTRIRPILEILP
jgi:predicted nuclease of predicted toxin-antitoxin system